MKVGIINKHYNISLENNNNNFIFIEFQEEASFYWFIRSLEVLKVSLKHSAVCFSYCQ